MANAAYAPREIKSLRALHDSVLITDMEFKERITTGGIIIPNDNGTGSGIRARWGKVYAVGPKHCDVVPGQWVLVEHGRWTRGIDIDDGNGVKTLRKIDPDCILLVSDDEPAGSEGVSDAIDVRSR